MAFFEDTINMRSCIFYIHVGQCSHGDIRLLGGNTSYEGRLEFCRSGIWGSVCGQYFDLDDARVVCRQLNLNITCKFYKINFS